MFSTEPFINVHYVPSAVCILFSLILTTLQDRFYSIIYYEEDIEAQRSKKKTKKKNNLPNFMSQNPYLQTPRFTLFLLHQCTSGGEEDSKSQRILIGPACVTCLSWDQSRWKERSVPYLAWPQSLPTTVLAGRVTIRSNRLRLGKGSCQIERRLEHTETIAICYFHPTIIIATGPTHILISFIFRIISMGASITITTFIESLGNVPCAFPVRYS